MKLESPDFGNNESIPLEYSCDGDEVSPPLSFHDIPAKAKSLALIMDDPDASKGPWIHWLIWDIPADKTMLSKGEKIPYPQGKNSAGIMGYGGPCPPQGTHRYFFRLYALDTILSLEKGSNRKQLEAAMTGHIIEEAQLIGTYTR